MKSDAVLHLDMDSYFATLEQQANPALRGKPIGVAGKPGSERTVLTTASIEAKRLGVKTAMSTWEAKRICPQLIIVPANYDRYIFTSQRIFSLLERFSPTVDVFSVDEAFLELPNWQDWQSAEEIARQIKATIRRQIGSIVTCSIGISYNKILAKLASEKQKPDGLTVIRSEDFHKIATETPIQDICGIGPRLGPRLNRLGIFTLADLGKTPLNLLVTVFGVSAGSWMHELGQGRSGGEIRSFRHLPQEKSISHSYTLPRDIASHEELKKVLLLLAERVGERLRQDNLRGRVVSLYLRSSNFGGWGQSIKQQEYLFDGYQIYQVATSLMAKSPPIGPVRLVGVAISDLTKQTLLSRPILPAIQKSERLISAVDKINSKQGMSTIHRAAIFPWRRRILNLPDGRTGRRYTPG